jgi:hypothetical protein
MLIHTRKEESWKKLKIHLVISLCVYTLVDYSNIAS